MGLEELPVYSITVKYFLLLSAAAVTFLIALTKYKIITTQRKGGCMVHRPR